jgi:hypothetical protein
MHRAGLRRAGVAAITLPILAAGLAREGIWEVKTRVSYDLEAVSRDGAKQQTILTQLSSLAETQREKVFVQITEKRRRTRDVGIPIELFQHLLVYIWTERKALMERLSRRKAHKGSDSLFCSLKTGTGLNAKSIGNLINNVFRLLKISGSAHRLRAAYAENVVRDAYLRARSIHGRACDANSVPLEAAEALGHKRTQTLRPYLHRILRENNLTKGEPILVSSSSGDARIGLSPE